MMRAAVFCFLALPFALAVPRTAAADPELECSSAGSQVEIGNCVAAMDEKVEAALAIALEIASGAAAELDDVTGRTAAVPALEEAQKAWATYRQTHCAFAGASYGGGSGAGIATRACWVRLGRERTDQLMRFAR